MSATAVVPEVTTKYAVCIRIEPRELGYKFPGWPESTCSACKSKVYIRQDQLVNPEVRALCIECTVEQLEKQPGYQKPTEAPKR